MKYAIILAGLIPASAMAHGDHAPLAEPAHAGFHAMPLLGLSVILLAAGLALAGWARS